MTLNFSTINSIKSLGKSLITLPNSRALGKINSASLRYINKDVAELKKYCLKESPVYNLIKDKVIVHVPENLKESVLKNYMDFVKTKADTNVLESLFIAAKLDAKGLSDYRIAKRFNTIFKNIRDLRNNSPQDYDLMIRGGFFDFVKNGKIALGNFITNMKKARISRSLADDLQKIANKESFIKDVSKLSESEILRTIKSGEVYERNGKLFINNNGLIHEINLTKEKFLELFPPVLRHISNQRALGNCWIVGRIDNLMSTTTGQTGLYQLFRQVGDDIYFKFPNSAKEILFPNSKTLISPNDKTMMAVPGVKMIEQGLAVHLGNAYSKGSVTNILKFENNVDKLMTNLSAYTLGNFKRLFAGKFFEEPLSVISKECVDTIVMDLRQNAYSRHNSLWDKIRDTYHLRGSGTRKENAKLVNKLIEQQANNTNLKINVGFKSNTPKEYADLHNMIPNHQLTLKGLEGNTCWISNPWFNWIEKGVDKNTFLNYLTDLDIPFVW